MSIFLDGLAIVCRRPTQVYRDDRKRLHSPDGPAILWRNNEAYYFWHGTRVTEQIILHPETITREQIMGEKNSEVSRAIAEKLGWYEYLKRAETILIHKWFDERISCHYELWDFKQRWERTPRLLKMESPETKDGTRPYYIEPVPPSMKTCQAAKRWQCDPSRPEEKECNENPKIDFEVEA